MKQFINTTLLQHKIKLQKQPFRVNIYFSKHYVYQRPSIAVYVFLESIKSILISILIKIAVNDALWKIKNVFVLGQKIYILSYYKYLKLY